jgi:flagellin
MGKSLEKLSSGLRINRAGDDAAGLAISEKMRGQIRGLDQATRNAQDGISLIQTAEGALTETHSILQRMRELAVQSANDTNNNTDRGELQKEITELKNELNRISSDTEFNTKKLLDGTLGTKLDEDTTNSTLLTNGAVDGVNYTGGLASGTWTLTGQGDGSYTISDGSTTYTSNIVAAGSAGTLDFQGKVSIEVNNSIADDALNGLVAKITGSQATFQIGANSGQSANISIGNMDAASLGIDAVDISSQSGADSAISSVQTAIESVSSERSKLGAMQNRLEHTINNLSVSSENLTAAESRIRDVDMAREMMKFTKDQILLQSSNAMLAQANQLPQNVLSLLR